MITIDGSTLKTTILFHELSKYDIVSYDDESGILFLFSEQELCELFDYMDIYCMRVSNSIRLNKAEFNQKIWRSVAGVFEPLNIFDLNTLECEYVVKITPRDNELHIKVKFQENFSINRLKVCDPSTYFKIQSWFIK